MDTHGKRGFTLIELVIVLLLAGIMAAIAAPSFNTYMKNSRLNGAARIVMTDLMFARGLAASENNLVRVFFVNSRTYKILDDDNGDGMQNNSELYVRTRDIRNEYHDVSISSNVSPLTFQPNGTVSGSTASITLNNAEGDTKKITVSLPGRVKIN
ncbi:MAG: GspH/FimT family protein [Syntrophales bacterium]|jgi:type IV fimbrial biogenesis protein FimT|nr:GspH/FimT family protein [Syntrophales bacterium]MDY0044593.1 GspH/FimT family protein [Syntrophales bacterium]